MPRNLRGTGSSFKTIPARSGLHLAGTRCTSSPLPQYHSIIPMPVLSAIDFQVNNDAVGQTAPCVTGIWERCRLRRDLHAKQVSGKGAKSPLYYECE